MVLIVDFYGEYKKVEPSEDLQEYIGCHAEFTEDFIYIGF